MYRQPPHFQQQPPLTPQQMAEQLQRQRQMQQPMQQPMQPQPQIPQYMQYPAMQQPQPQMPAYTQQPMQMQQPMQHPVMQQPQPHQSFGQQQVPGRDSHGSGGSIRSRKTRVSTVTEQRTPEIPPIRGITGSVTYPQSTPIHDPTEQVLLEPGITLVGAQSINNETIYRGESKMSELNVSALVCDTNETMVPVPDVNIVGDVVYASLRIAADATENTFDVVHRDDDAGYMFYVPSGKEHALEAEYVDVNSFMAALATDLATGSPVAKYIDTRLTMLFNTVLHDIIGSNATVDSLGLDYVDMNAYARTNFSEDALRQYAELIGTISKVSSNITLKTEEDESKLVRLFIKETCVVIDTNTSDALNIEDIGNNYAFITAESTPVIHRALSEVLERSPSVTYLLTDTYKYLLATVASSGKICIKSVVAK